jgi:hypothetical protein
MILEHKNHHSTPFLSSFQMISMCFCIIQKTAKIGAYKSIDTHFIEGCDLTFLTVVTDMGSEQVDELTSERV